MSLQIIYITLGAYISSRYCRCQDWYVELWNKHLWPHCYIITQISCTIIPCLVSDFCRRDNICKDFRNSYLPYLCNDTFFLSVVEDFLLLHILVIMRSRYDNLIVIINIIIIIIIIFLLYNFSWFLHRLCWPLHSCHFSPVYCRRDFMVSDTWTAVSATIFLYSMKTPSLLAHFVGKPIFARGILRLNFFM